MKAAIARRRARAPGEISAGTFLAVVCTALALLCLASHSAAAE